MCLLSSQCCLLFFPFPGFFSLPQAPSPILPIPMFDQPHCSSLLSTEPGSASRSGSGVPSTCCHQQNPMGIEQDPSIPPLPPVPRPSLGTTAPPAPGAGILSQAATPWISHQNLCVQPRCKRQPLTQAGLPSKMSQISLLRR